MLDWKVIAAGLIAYAVAVLVATLLVFLGYRISVRLTVKLEEERLLLAGHRSVAIGLGAVLLSQAVLMRHALFPVMVVLRGLFLEPYDAGRLTLTLAQCAAFIAAIGVVSVGSVLLAGWLFTRLTGRIPEHDEILADNLAVAIFFAIALLAITLVLDRGVEDLARSLVPYDQTGILHIP
jgi:uncharacterized membrane protein YjfL (UPF0719 family)